MNQESDDDHRLARRYRTLLRAYPKNYRQQRGEEILGTLLDAARPGQSRPSLADATDLIAAGVRQRLAVDALPSLHRGLLLAGPVALGLAAGLSLFFWLGAESTPYQPGPRLGPFTSLAPLAYLGWLLAVLAPIALPRFGRRPWVGLALLLTGVVPLLALASPYAAPPTYVTVLLGGLGAVALLGEDATQPGRHRARVAEVAFATTPLCFGIAWLQGAPFPELLRLAYSQVTTVVAVVVLLALVAVVAVGITQVVRRRDTSWSWAAAVLLIPLGWLAPQAFQSGEPDLTSAPAYLALSMALVIAVVWLARHAADTPDGSAVGAAPAVVRPDRVIPAAGAVALGCAAGLAAFLLIAELTAGRADPWLPAEVMPAWDRTALWLYAGWVAVTLVAMLVPWHRVRLGLIGVAVAATLGSYLLPRFIHAESVPVAPLLVLALLGVTGLAATRLPVRRFVSRTATATLGVLGVLGGLAYGLNWLAPRLVPMEPAAVSALTPHSDPAPHRILVKDRPGDEVIVIEPHDGVAEAIALRWYTEGAGLAPEVIQTAALIAAVPLVFAAVILLRALLDRIYRAPTS